MSGDPVSLDAGFDALAQTQAADGSRLDTTMISSPRAHARDPAAPAQLRDHHRDGGDGRAKRRDQA
jgi:hypothetical protein